MSEQVYSQVEDAIQRNLYCFKATRPGYGTPAWVRPIRVEFGEIIMLWGDCGVESNPGDIQTWSVGDWLSAVKPDGTGLYRKTGFWSFTPDKDPAADCIKYCHQHPDSAGRELYKLRCKIEQIKKRGELR